MKTICTDNISFRVMLNLVEQAPTFLNAFHPYGDRLIHLIQHKSVKRMSHNANQEVPKLRSESWSTSSCAGHDSLIISKLKTLCQQNRQSKRCPSISSCSGSGTSSWAIIRTQDVLQGSANFCLPLEQHLSHHARQQWLHHNMDQSSQCPISSCH